MKNNTNRYTKIGILHANLNSNFQDYLFLTKIIAEEVAQKVHQLNIQPNKMKNRAKHTILMDNNI